jgi:predicted dehydrogenase
MAKLRLGVIGAGSWAVASHLPNLQRHADTVEFVAVNRLGREPLERIRERFGFQLASEDYRDVLKAGIDICVIASPSGLHYEHAKAALEAGAHILLEKPVTIDPAQAWDLVEIAQRLQRHAVVSFGWNYKSMVREARRLLSDGAGIGVIEQLVITMSSQTRELLSNSGAYPAAAPESLPEAATWTDPRVSGGGYGQAQLTHALGLALWLTGLRGKEVFALMSASLAAPVELYDAIVVRYDNGAIGTLSGGSAHLEANKNKHQLEVRAIGSQGQFQIDLDRELVWRFRAPSADVRLAVDAGSGLYDCVGPIDTLVELGLGREVENCSQLELGARTVEILAAAYRSAESGKLEAVTTLNLPLRAR